MNLNLKFWIILHNSTNCFRILRPVLLLTSLLNGCGNITIALILNSTQEIWIDYRKYVRFHLYILNIKNFTNLKFIRFQLHAIACCLKAVCTSDASIGVETCRLACGGHGYMTSSNLHNTYSLTTAACTYEGENTVLLLQTARYY